jgi:addiction module HigA family antidote
MERLPNIHPGEILQTEFLEPMHITVPELAKSVNLPLKHIQEIVCGERTVTADTAWRLGRFFGMNPRFWMNLQAHYDLEEAQPRHGVAYEQIVITSSLNVAA